MVSDFQHIYVTEIFKSLQGEGLKRGFPTTFVRFQGCNLYPRVCAYCDTVKSQNPDSQEATLYNVRDIFEKIKDSNNVCITGGEPLLQEDALLYLLTLLYNVTSSVEIETNGTMYPDWVFDIINSPGVTWNVDIKCPCSCVPSTPNIWHQWNFPPNVVFKFVVETDRDLEFALKVSKDLYHKRPKLLSPKWGSNNYFIKSCVDFCIENNFIMNNQLHKVLGIS